jgi:hypothetical protein
MQVSIARNRRTTKQEAQLSKGILKRHCRKGLCKQSGASIGSIAGKEHVPRGSEILASLDRAAEHCLETTCITRDASLSLATNKRVRGNTAWMRRVGSTCTPCDKSQPQGMQGRRRGCILTLFRHGVLLRTRPAYCCIALPEFSLPQSAGVRSRITRHLAHQNICKVERLNDDFEALLYQGSMCSGSCTWS